MKLTLVKLTEQYRGHLFEMMEEWTASGEKIVPYAIRKNDYREFEHYVKNLDVTEPAGGLVPDTTFFCLDEERDKFVGAVNIRMYLTEELLLSGGHIGDGVRPSERRKGIATQMIGLALLECKKLGLHRVLMVCDKENTGSVKSIVNNGGVLENEVEVCGVTEQRYWITLSPLALEEFDYSAEAVINPHDIFSPVRGMPKVLVSCFSHVTFERMTALLSKVEQIAECGDAARTYPIYKGTYSGTELALVNMPVGAASTVGLLEDVFEMGVEQVVLFGTCGVLEERIRDCAVIVPDRAVREEGVSFQYAPASNEIMVNVGTKEPFLRYLERIGCPYTVGKTWTTDGFYRETKRKTARRREQGCICVDMECSAVAAAAQFRNKRVLQFFYAADVVGTGEWEPRSLGNQARLEEKDRISLLALEYAKTLFCFRKI